MSNAFAANPIRSNIRQAVLAERAALEARYPEHFRVNWLRRAVTISTGCFIVGVLIFGLWQFEFSWTKIFNGIGQLGTFAKLMVPPTPESWTRFFVYLNALGETLAIAFLGTLLAALFAFPLGFLAAKNVMPVAILHFFSRRSLDTIRGVDTLIWALIWINVVGLGPFAGVLAIMTSDIGSFGKLFSEAIEAADRKPVEGVTSAGGSALHNIRFGLLPQILPVMASQILYYFESNTRSATIIGVVGAGGLGLHLYEQIRTLEWQHVSFLILMILVTVAVIDFVSSKLRFAIIGTSAAPTT